MSQSLTNLTISGTYSNVLTTQVVGDPDSNGLPTDLLSELSRQRGRIQDGSGTATPLLLSNTMVEVDVVPTTPNSVLRLKDIENIIDINDEIIQGIQPIINRLDDFRDVKTFFVSKRISASDDNNGTSPGEPFLTLRAAKDAANAYLEENPSHKVVIELGPGTYIETGLPFRFRPNVCVKGVLRATTIKPAPGEEFNDIFKVDSGFLAWGLTFSGHQADSTNGSQAWAISFNDQADNSIYGAVGPGAYILKSPYIQNCTSLTAEDNDPPGSAGEAGSQSTGDTGGGMLVDGKMCAINSPIRSMVVDSYTQVNLGGPGCLVRNDGYAQLVSFFALFCNYHVRTETGGQVNLSGGGTSDFGIYGLMADGFSPDPLYTGIAREAYFGTERYEGLISIDPNTNLFTSVTGSETLIPVPHELQIGDRVTFRPIDSDLSPELQVGENYYVISQGFSSTTFKISTAPGGSELDVTGGDVSPHKVIRQGDVEIDVIDFTANRLGKQIKYPTAGSVGSPGNPVIISSVAGNNFTVQLDTAPFSHTYVAGGVVQIGTQQYHILTANYDHETGVGIFSAQGFIPQIGQSVSLTGLSFICSSSTRPNAGQLFFPQLQFPSAGSPGSVGNAVQITAIDGKTFTITTSPSSFEHKYVNGGEVVIGSTLHKVTDATYDYTNGLTTITTDTYTPQIGQSVALQNLNWICPSSSSYVITGSVPIDIDGNTVDNTSPDRAGYRIKFYSPLSAGLRYSLAQGQTIDFRNRSQISAPNHTFEYVGSGTNYDALPWNGGVPIPANKIVETNNGRVYSTNTDEIGNYAVGTQFTVDGTTGSVTINTDQFNLSGLNFIGPFSRDGGISTVGEQLREVSNNTSLIASTGAPDGNTVPTQFAVKEFVGSRYVTNVTTSTPSLLTISGSAQRDGVGNWTYNKNISLNISSIYTGISGDITISGSGVASITSGVITNADIASNANITGSKIAAATTTTAGVVTLSTSTSSTSTTTAATSSAVKVAFDKAQEAYDEAIAPRPTGISIGLAIALG